MARTNSKMTISVDMPESARRPALPNQPVDSGTGS
jgi:hypothetical protein